ncbi:preprotein translocase subunit SecG [Erythrobacter sp. HA6-11]
MSLFLFLTVVQTIVAAALVGVILMQRSEGGGLGIGGSPGGVMGARGAADFLTRSTKWLAIVFVALSIALAAVAVDTSGTDEITSTLDREVTPAAPADPLASPGADPLAAPAQSTPAGEDPLAGASE